MKKIIGAIGGCIAAYYVIDVVAAITMATAWGDLVKSRVVHSAVTNTAHEGS